MNTDKTYPLPEGVDIPYEVLFFPNGNSAVCSKAGKQIGFFQLGHHGDTVAALALFGYDFEKMCRMGYPNEQDKWFTQDQLEAQLLYGWKVDPCDWDFPDEITWIEPKGEKHHAPGKWRVFPLPWPESAAKSLVKYKKSEWAKDPCFVSDVPEHFVHRKGYL